MKDTVKEIRKKSAPEERPTDAETAIMLFELWQDNLINGTGKDPRRFKDELLKHYDGAKDPFVFMFIGFVGGLDICEPLLNK